MLPAKIYFRLHLRGRTEHSKMKNIYKSIGREASLIPLHKLSQTRVLFPFTNFPVPEAHRPVRYGQLEWRYSVVR